jgi:spore coat polysaccharide biosynthesis protein SpsF
MSRYEFKTDQESFWAGKFGNDYIERNSDNSNNIAANINLFSKILEKTSNIKSIIEFGANIGNNIDAIKFLLPNCNFSAVEINTKAADILRSKNKDVKVYNDSILDFAIEQKCDLSLAKGVLIHINPNELQAVYQKLYDASKRYILIIEYYNPTPVEVNYRGHEGKLFKRDFAGELLDKYSDLSLIGYGFAYHRDNNFFQDDLTWFLLQKI